MTALYEITAERNAKKVKLKFLTPMLANDTARELRRQGFEVDYRHPDAYQIEACVRDAVVTALRATD